MSNFCSDNIRGNKTHWAAASFNSNSISQIRKNQIAAMAKYGTV